MSTENLRGTIILMQGTGGGAVLEEPILLEGPQVISGAPIDGTNMLMENNSIALVE